MRIKIKILFYFFLTCATTTIVEAQKIPKSPLPATVRVESRARFRVTLNGFAVNRQTWDNAGQWDGKDDEIFFLVKVAEFAKSRNQTEAAVRVLPLRTSRIMGDTNNQNGRAQAGSASSLGGLRTGDRFPSQEPWQRAENPKPDSLPMLLWEGELIKGEAWTTIIPTVWEWDNGDLNLRQSWSSYSEYWFNTSKGDPEIYKTPLVRLVDVAGANPQYDGFEKLIGREEDRPIGIRKFQNGGLNFEPYWVTLTFENALRAASDNPTNKGVGIVEINYTDNVDFKGDYTIYLQIERLP